MLCITDHSYHPYQRDSTAAMNRVPFCESSNKEKSQKITFDIFVTAIVRGPIFAITRVFIGIIGIFFVGRTKWWIDEDNNPQTHS